jgi:acyl-coenzyme A synthetase/AMP-(fatty) acid ligase
LSAVDKQRQGHGVVSCVFIGLVVGTLAHLGCLDDQAKERSIRIELGETEAVLAEHPEVRQAAVHLWTVKAADVRIVACCVRARAGVSTMSHVPLSSRRL